MEEEIIEIDKYVNWKVIRFVKGDCDQSVTSERTTRKEEELYLIEDKNENIISYDRMQGRPSTIIKIKGHEIDCLLDTGATVNVMSRERFNKLPEIELKTTYDTLRCANDYTLETMGKAAMKVEINGRCHTVPSTIVRHMTLEVIGGIGLQKLFEIELHWPTTTDKIKDDNYICNIDAKFGREATEEERF